MILGALFLIVLPLPITILTEAVEIPILQNFVLCRSSITCNISPVTGSFDVSLVNDAVEIDTLSAVSGSGRRDDNPGIMVTLGNPSQFKVHVTAVGTGVARVWLTLEFASFS